MDVGVWFKPTCTIADASNDDHRANFRHDSASSEEPSVLQDVQLLCNSTGYTSLEEKRSVE